MIKDRTVSQVLFEQYQKKSSSIKINIDLLLEVPNLGLADGYGQSARSIVEALEAVAKEENLSFKIVNKRNLCKPIDRKEEFNRVRQYLIEEENIGEVGIFFRYSLPKPHRYKAKRAIIMTMFESSIVPPSWINALNSFDLVINPTEWGAKVFSKHIRTNVKTIPLNINSEYYEELSEQKLLPPKDTFRFLTVGNYFQPDRKRIIPLIDAFHKKMKGNCELYVKSSWTDKGSPKTIPIDKFCSDKENVILDLRNISTAELINIYTSSHATLFPSLGEGFGLPHVESSILGRPLIVSDNTSMTSLKEYMPCCTALPCRAIPSDYSPQKIFKAGNWFECNINNFISEAQKLYELWEEDKDKYNNNILLYYKENKLRDYISKEHTKEMFKKIIKEEFGKI